MKLDRPFLNIGLKLSCPLEMHEQQRIWHMVKTRQCLPHKEILYGDLIWGDTATYKSLAFYTCLCFHHCDCRFAHCIPRGKLINQAQCDKTVMKCFVLGKITCWATQQSFKTWPNQKVHTLFLAGILSSCFPEMRAHHCHLLLTDAA
jgi:hypothetical protein